MSINEEDKYNIYQIITIDTNHLKQFEQQKAIKSKTQYPKLNIFLIELCLKNVH